MIVRPAILGGPATGGREAALDLDSTTAADCVRNKHKNENCTTGHV